MLFRVIAVVASLAFIAQGAPVELTIPQVVTNINIVATVSERAKEAIAQISPSTPAPQVADAAKSLATSFDTIVQSLAGDVSAMKTTPPFPDCSATQPIIDSLTNFVLIHQELLSTVIGQHGILAEFGATAPVATALRALETGIDSFAFAMIKMLPSCRKDSVTQDQTGLDKSVKDAISTYEEICLPIPFVYPPVCL